MKFRTFITPLAVSAGLVLILGLGILGGLTLRRPLALIDQGGQALPTALQFVPKQSSLVASVLVRPDRLANLWSYLTAPKLRQATKDDIQAIERALLANTGLTYSQDIQPWLGEEITVAMVSPDLDQNPDNGANPGYLVALACRDSLAAKAVLELFWQNRAIAGEALTFEDFLGSRLIYARPSLTTAKTGGSGLAALAPLATTLVANQFVLVANDPVVLRQALTAAQSKDTSLQFDHRYKTALQELPHNPVGLLAFSLSGSPAWPSQTADSVNYLSLQPNGTDNPLDWGLVSLGLNSKGVIADTVLVAAPGHRLQVRHKNLDDWSGLAQFLPDQLALAAIGSDLGTWIQDLRPLGRLIAESSAWPNPIGQSLAQALGSDSLELILTGATQNFALGSSRPWSQESDWLLVTQRSDAMEAALEDLTALAQDRGLGVSSLDIEGYPTTALTKLSLGYNQGGSGPGETWQVVTQVAALWAKIDNYDLLTATPGTLAAILQLRQGPLQVPPWSQDIEVFQRPGEGYIHINWPQLQADLGQQIPRFRLWETAARPILKHLNQILLTSYGRTEQIQTGSIFFQLSNE